MTTIDTSCKWHLEKERRKKLNLLPLHMELQDRLGQREHDENTSKEKFLKEKIPRHALSLSDRECGKNNTPFPFWRERESRPLFTSYFHPKDLVFLLLGIKFEKNTFNSNKLPVVNPNQCVLCLRSQFVVLEMYKRSFPIGYRQTPLVLPPSLSPLSVLYPSFSKRGCVSGSSTFPFSTSGFRSIIGRRPNFNM